MIQERRFGTRRHKCARRCEKRGNMDCKLFNCSEEYCNFYYTIEKLQSDLNHIINSIKESLHKSSNNL